MTVKELIDKLQAIPRDTEVIVAVDAEWNAWGHAELEWNDNKIVIFPIDNNEFE